MTRHRPIVIAILLLALSGCAQYDAFSEAVSTSAAAAADRSLKAAWWTECRMPTIGALWRLYRYDKAGWEVYAAHCLRDAPHMAEGMAEPK